MSTLPSKIAAVGLLTTLLTLAAPFSSAAAPPATQPPRGGIGIQVVPLATGDLVVLKVLDNSPAKKVGIVPGDVIRSVDGHRLRGTKFEDAAKKWLWGDAGKAVEIALQRPGQTGTLRVTLTRVALPAEESAVPEVRMLTPEQGGKK